MSMHKVNLAQKLASFSDHFSPKIVGEVNDCHVKLVKAKGDFVWHHHENEDELFLVVYGSFVMKFRDASGAERAEAIREGEFFIVPRGVEHCPVAQEEVHILLIEPKATLNTGNLVNERTVAELEHI
jgi:mannose-6-phosphate isomerase-like protein (cupin superfamily)